MDYLFEFSGRINRAKMWLFLLVMIGWNALTFVVVAFGFDWTEFFASFRAQIHPGGEHLDWSALAWPSLQSAQATLAVAILILMFFLACWANLAVTTKRLHDRDRSIWWLVPFIFLPWVLSWTQMLAGPLLGFTPNVLMAAGFCGLLSFVLDVWAFIELFCLRGTTGTNRFGPDPLSASRGYFDV